jgi:hypothetical protein
MAFLSDKNQKYYGKALELRDAVSGWLSYIPQTFPHYTTHTIDHSEEIISQVSHLLFRNANPRTPVLDELSATEAYILVAAAYLHDIGMVVSDKDKLRILGSEEWGNWVRNGGGGESRWVAIDAFRNGPVPADSSIRNFIADLQLRHLIADFVRRNHHMRSADLLSLYENELGRFGFQDPLLVQSIANVCLAHGLPPHELDNRERFPVRAMIQGELVNVRLLAIMLRLGDLLDIRHERACPLLLNAACPLPPDSLAHWTQYQRFKHRLTAFDRVEIVAECETRDEHRYLQDWFQWLVDELTSARTMMAGSSRHGTWEAPLATMSGSDPTILIRPALSAKYLPVNWIFEFTTVQLRTSENSVSSLTYIR